MNSQQTASANTTALFLAIANRILTYVPTGTVMPALPLSSVLQGAGVWATALPDRAPFPCVLVNVDDRRGDGWQHGAQEDFKLIVQVFTRPRSWGEPGIGGKGIQQLHAIADQVQVALTEWAEPTTPIKVYAMDRRRDMAQDANFLDRDVVREYLEFPGVWWPAYVSTEIGSS